MAQTINQNKSRWNFSFVSLPKSLTRPGKHFLQYECPLLHFLSFPIQIKIPFDFLCFQIAEVGLK